MNQHWWGSINKASKSACLAHLICPNTIRGKSLPETLHRLTPTGGLANVLPIASLSPLIQTRLL